jgi:cobalt-zinc-cadmium resistance protein CzcA
MLERIISTTLKQKGMVIFLTFMVIGLGIYSYIKLPIDAFPDVTNIQVDVVSYANGLSAAEIERSITYPVEMSMRGLPKVKQMRSVTKFGLSIVTIIFEDNVDIYFARQLVFERLAEARENVPENVEISMGPMATVMGEIYQFTLQGKMPTDTNKIKDYLTELRTLEEWVVNPLLKSVPGVNEINSFGGYFKQYEVVVSPDKLLKYDLTIDEVFAAIGKNNQNAGGNIVEKYADQYIVRGVGLIKDTVDIGNIGLKSFEGTPTYLKDVAQIKVGVSVRQGASMINGTDEAVGGIVMMLRGENSRDVVNRVKAKVAEINSNNVLPQGIKIVPFYDRSDIINASVGTVNKALLEGALLVLTVLYLLLRSIRGSLVVLMGLPLSLLVTFIVMKLSGLSANLMSIGGLTISIGMIMDSAIIQVENVQRQLNEDPHKGNRILTVLKAVLAVQKPSIFGVLIIAITFIPVLSLSGIEGKMFAPLAKTVVIALLSSLAISILITPGLCLLFLKPQVKKEGGIMAFIKKGYMPLLRICMKKKKIIIGIAAALLCISLALFTKIGTEFMPIMDENAFDLDVSLLPGVSLNKAMEINQLIAKKMKQFPELKTCVSRTGQTGVALDTRGVDKTGYVGVLYPKKEWKSGMSHEELTNAMRDSLASIPGIAYSFSQPIQCRIDELVAGTKAQLILKLFGENMDVLKTKSGEIAALLSSVKGCADLVTEKISGQPYLTIEIDRLKIARYGLNISDVQEIIEVALAGKSATKLFEENKSFDITVRLPEEDRNSVETIGNILVPTSSGSRIPLFQLANIFVSEGPVQISRDDGLRRIGIELNVSGRDIGSFVEEAKKLIKNKANLPPGYYVTWGGQFENQQRAMSKIMTIGPIAVGLILLLLFAAFRNIRLALLVISNLPLALTGGIFALWISGSYLSVPAAVGFIVLFGVAVLNGVVLVSHIIQLRDEGMELTKAVQNGCANRLRPVLMTASISIFSLLPMLYSSGVGSETQKPLAIVVIGGLVTSTLLTLFLVPALYGWFENRKKDNTI